VEADYVSVLHDGRFTDGFAEAVEPVAHAVLDPRKRLENASHGTVRVPERCPICANGGLNRADYKPRIVQAVYVDVVVPSTMV
jgi:hypothetical protein